MKHKCFLWPDRPIRKRDAKRIREDHNAAINDLCEANEALTALLTWISTEKPELPRKDDAWGASAITRARNIIAKLSKD